MYIFHSEAGSSWRLMSGSDKNSSNSALLQLPANPVKSLAGAGFDRISKRRPDSGFAGAGAEIWYIPKL